MSDPQNPMIAIMAAHIAGGLLANYTDSQVGGDGCLLPSVLKTVTKTSVILARLLVAEVARTEPA